MQYLYSFEFALSYMTLLLADTEPLLDRRLRQTAALHRPSFRIRAFSHVLAIMFMRKRAMRLSKMSR